MLRPIIASATASANRLSSLRPFLSAFTLVPSRSLSSLDELSPVQLTPLQKVLLSVGSSIGVFMDPRRADLLSIFAETTGTSALRYMQQKMLEDPVGSRILREKPRIRTYTLDLDRLRQLPENTLGRAYATFMDHYHYSPDERPIVRYVEDPELAYVMQRYREIHDLVHTMLEQPTDMLGEVVVKWVEGVQNRLPMCVTGGLFGSLRLAPKQTQNYLNTHLDYALRVGLHGKFLMNVYFEDHWEWDMGELRASLNIPPPPKRLPKSKAPRKPATNKV